MSDQANTSDNENLRRNTVWLSVVFIGAVILPLVSGGQTGFRLTVVFCVAMGIWLSYMAPRTAGGKITMAIIGFFVAGAVARLGLALGFLLR